VKLSKFEEIINPVETILVADSLTGQVAANVAKRI
jgi:Signal recognition particle GTPase